MLKKIKVLKSQITNDIKKIEKIFIRFDDAYSEFIISKEYSKLVESAFYLNQISTGFERIFKGIAKTFENNIDEISWHKDIIEKMLLDIEGIRPAVITETSFNYLNELRTFRHFFRHAYDVDIEDEKFNIVAQKALLLRKVYQQDFANFGRFLDELLTDTD